MEAIDKYLEATLHQLAIEDERYGGGWRAIVAPSAAIEFLFEMLCGDDIEGTQAQLFLSTNPLFPSAWGKTPSEALQNLDTKLALLYRFESVSAKFRCNWSLVPQFSLLALHDPEPGESPSSYQVEWVDIVQDLRAARAETNYFYDEARDSSSATKMRDLHALVNFKYDGTFAQLKTI